MARGSDGAGGGSNNSHTGIEMLGGGGGVDSRGKTVLNKKYFITNSTELDNAPIINGYQATNISYTRLNDTAYEQNVTYEALTSNSGDGSTVWLQNGVKGTFEMFCSFETKPIALHPRIESLKQKYQGFPDGATVYFPYYYIDGTAGGLSDSKPAKNPMYGITHFKEPSMILRHTYFSRSLNGSIWAVTGRVTTRLPAGIPLPKGDLDDKGKEIPREWMMQAPSVTRQGDAWQVVQEYVLLDATGVADQIYIKGQTPGTPA